MNFSFLKRLGYYLGGFSVGLILLTFILSGKKTSCNYGPNARVLDNLSEKPIVIPTALKAKYHTLTDSLVQQLLTSGTVDFSKSDTKRDSCRLYHIDAAHKKSYLVVENCAKTVRIVDYKVALD